MEARKDIAVAGLSLPSSFTPGLRNIRWLSCLQVFCRLQLCSHSASRTGAWVLALLNQKGCSWGKEMHSCRWSCCQRRCKMEAEASLWVFTGSNGLPKSSYNFRAESLVLRKKDGTAFVLNAISPSKCAWNTKATIWNYANRVYYAMLAKESAQQTWWPFCVVVPEDCCALQLSVFLLVLPNYCLCYLAKRYFDCWVFL